MSSYCDRIDVPKLIQNYCVLKDTIMKNANVTIDHNVTF